MSDTTISRRYALRTGTLSALGVGLMAAAGAAPVAAEPASPTATPPLARVVNFPELAAESRRLAALCHETQQATGPASEALKAQIGEEHYRLAMAYMEGPHDQQRDVWHDLVVAELMRHLPGVAPAIGVVWLHIMESGYDEHGRCCVDEVDGRA
jgi:hypothetical protein